LKSKVVISFGININDMNFVQFLQYSFIQNAIIAGCFVALPCSILGVFLVLRKISSIGDGISHISFGAIALGLFLGIYPLYIAIPIVILASLVILKINEKARIYGDAAIGIISSLGISVGIILTSLSNGFNVNLFSYLFGNILAISNGEVYISIALSVTVLVAIYFLYWDLLSTTFDEEYAKTTGIKIEFINILLTILTAITVVLSIKIVGVMLVSALLIIPASTALQLCKRFKTTLLVSSLSAIISVLMGVLVSLNMDLPAGAMIVITSIFILIFSLIYRILLKH
jgi:zinc transport system permease protein